MRKIVTSEGNSCWKSAHADDILPFLHLDGEEEAFLPVVGDQAFCLRIFLPDVGDVFQADIVAFRVGIDNLLLHVIDGVQRFGYIDRLDVFG